MNNYQLKTNTGNSIVSMTPMNHGTELDTMSNVSVLKVVNNDTDVTPVTPVDDNQGGIFASLKAVFSGGVFRTDTKKTEGGLDALEDSIIIEQKSSEKENESSAKKPKVSKQLLDGSQDGDDGLPQTVDCNDYAYQDGEDEDQDLRTSKNRKLYSESFDPLNEAQINSKPISMNVLDELENFWEKTEASQGKKGILAEHIMERHAHEIMNGGESKG